MNRRTRVILVSAAALVVTLAAAVRYLGSTEAAPLAPANPRWTAGDARQYRLDWQLNQTTRLPDGTLASGRLALDADLQLLPLEVSDQGALIALRFTQVRTGTLELFGRAAPVEGLDSSEAWVTLDAHGQAKAVRFGPGDVPVFRYLSQGLAAELFPTLPESDDQVLSEPLTLGVALTRVLWTDSDRRSLVRERQRYLTFSLPGTPTQQKLDSHASFHFSAAGPLESVEANEQFDARDAKDRLALWASHLSLQFLSAHPASTEHLASARTDLRLLGAGKSEIDLERAQLESQVGDLTFEQLLQGLDGDEGGRGHERFVWQASGFLKLHPERCRDLVGYFEQAKNEHQQAFAVDLLVSAGHPDAQAALLKMFASPAAQKVPGVYHQLFQRLGLLQKPTDETIAAVEKAHQEAKAAHDDSALAMGAFTLGAMAAKVRTEGQTARSHALVDTLFDDYRTAPSADARRLALRALGNAADSRTLEVVKGDLDSPDLAVRADAAAALREVKEPEATEALISMVAGERSATVQSAAFDALEHRTLSEADLGALRGLVVDGRLDPKAASELLRLLAQVPAGSPSVVQTLQALSVQQQLPAQVRARAASLIAHASL